jgi:methyltransferase (TIGR00027 family)
MVAFWRALADVGATTIPGFSDPVARRMLGRTGAWLLRRSERRFSGMTADERRGAVSRIEGVTLRVVAIDAEIRRAVAAGVHQVVILGAGFDTRAWRMAELAGATVFEVDHPATQAAKRERTAGIPLVAADLRFVPVDFTRDSLPDALATAGHAADQPTVWVWEGVTMYLGDDALRSTLAAVRSRSAPGSALLAHYHEPPQSGRQSLVRRVIFRALGEPQVGLRTRAAMQSELDRAGFRVERDTSGLDQARQFGAAEPAGIARVSRLAVAAPARLRR